MHISLHGRQRATGARPSLAIDKSDVAMSRLTIDIVRYDRPGATCSRRIRQSLFCWLNFHCQDRRLHRSLTHILPGVFPQPFYVAYRRCAEELLIFTVEIRGVVISHTIAGTRGI